MRALFILCGFLFLSFSISAQTKIGDNPATPRDPSAMLEVSSSASPFRGFLMPRLTTVQRDAITLPATGLMIYNTTSNQTQVNIGTPAAPIWTTPSSPSWLLNGNTGTNAAANFLGTTDNQDLVVRTNNLERMRLDVGGRLGLGTATPVSHLTVASDGMGGGVADDIEIASYNASPAPAFYFKNARGTQAAPTAVASGTQTGIIGFFAQTTGSFEQQSYIASSYVGDGTNQMSNLRFGTTTVERMRIDQDGNIGIGTTAPAYPLHVIGTGGSIASSARIVASQSTGPVWTANTSASGNVTIYTNGWIGTASGIVIHSDARIKNILGFTNSSEDLETLRKIKITDYTKIDQAEDTRHYKKVTAQQVESVYPMAVLTSPNYIPNVYQTASSVQPDNGVTTITVDKTHEFKTGDQVRLETSANGPAFFPVTVLDEHRFTVNHVFDTDKVFVYGKLVKDFKSVDYESIAMLNVSATQGLADKVDELENKVKMLTTENEQLKIQVRRMAELEASFKKLEARLGVAGK